MTSDMMGNLSSRVASLNYLQGDVSDLKQRMAEVEELKQLVDDLERKINSLAEPAEGEIIEGRPHRTSSLPELSDAAERSLLYDIQSHFVCESCGSTHLVAALVKCTECSHQAWFGWSPAPEQKRKRAKPVENRPAKSPKDQTARS
jgi:hypothetical protein